MKKLFLASVAVLVIGSSMTVQAQNTKLSAPESQQVEDQFMVSMFEKDIQKAVSNYYKKNGKSESITLMYNWNKDNVVNVLQSEKGHVLKAPYEIQFIVDSYSNGKLGTETVTFGVIPENQQGQLEVKLVSYKHKAP